MIGRKFPVLDHGHVVLMDVMGNDEAILQAARTSYQGGTKSVSDDRALIRYLMRHEHATPFEAGYLKFHVKLPIFVERQWVRHRAAGLNEVSARYSVLPEETYLPEASAICEQSGSNKQGRGESMEQYADDFQVGCRNVTRAAFATYRSDLEQGVARELARINLPLGTYTEKVWWCNLRNLLHFLGLRMDSHAQWEIRQYANIIGNEIVAKLFPWTWEAFRDYRLNGMHLSALEVNAIPLIAVAENTTSAIHEYFKDAGGNKREADEAMEKFKRLGLIKETENA